MGCGALAHYKLSTDMDFVLRQTGNCTASSYKGLWQLRREQREGHLQVQETEDFYSDAITAIMGGANKLSGLSIVEVLEIAVIQNSAEHPCLVGMEAREPGRGIELARKRVKQSGPGAQLRARILYPAGWITVANTGKPDVPIPHTEAPSAAGMSKIWYSAEHVPTKHIWLKVQGCEEQESNGSYQLCENSAFSASRMYRRSEYPVWRKIRVVHGKVQQSLSAEQGQHWERYLSYSKSKGAWTVDGNGDEVKDEGPYYTTSSQVPWAGIDTPLLGLKWDKGTEVRLPDMRQGVNMLVVEPGKGKSTNIGHVKWVCRDGSAVISFAGVDKLVGLEKLMKAEVLGTGAMAPLLS